MKLTLSPRTLKLLATGCGLAGCGLRLALFATGVDGKGLLISGHPAWIGLLILTAVTALILLWGTAPLKAVTGETGSFSPSGWLGCGLFAAAALVIALMALPAAPIQAVAGAAAAIAFAAAAVCRFRRRKTNFLLHVVICVFFITQMLSFYQTWSFHPQLQDYCFQLLACIALTLMAYRLASFDIHRGSHRLLWITGLSAVYLCCLCLDCGPLFPAGAAWAFTNLTTLQAET